MGFCARLIASQTVTAVHDISDGGLAVALAEMAMAGAIGASIEISPSLLRPASLRRGSGALCRHSRAGKRGGDPGCGGTRWSRLRNHRRNRRDTLTLSAGTAILLDDLALANEAWLPRYMAQSHS